jgi:hypothetical protein
LADVFAEIVYVEARLVPSSWETLLGVCEELLQARNTHGIIAY